jgi:hypothetical protein
VEKRDLKADLELCNKATPGPWYRKKTGANFKGFSSEVIIADTSRYATGNKVYAESKGGQFPANDADFIAQAREGWPHAIERAIKAESLARELVGVIDDLRRQINQCGLDEQMWEVYRKAKEILGDE